MTASIHYLRPYHEARLDDIPLLWVMPDEAPTGIVLHTPDFTQRREDTLALLKLHAAEGRVAVSFDAPRHGARGIGQPELLRDEAQAHYARVMWTLLGDTILDIPTISTWARMRFGDLPLTLSGFGFGGDVALGAARMVSNVAEVCVIGASPDWSAPLPMLGEVAGGPDARATLLRGMLEPTLHAADYTDQRIHFLKTNEDPRAEAIDRFKAAVIAATEAEGGYIMTTTLAGRVGTDMTDPTIWWPHLGRLAA